jgi:hypothetical protein
VDHLEGAPVQRRHGDHLEAVAPARGVDVRGTPFALTRNVFRGGNYSVFFAHLTTPGVSPGQIQDNDFDGRGAYMVYMYNVNYPVGSTETTIPLGGNYWYRGSNPPMAPVALGNSSNMGVDFGNPAAPLTSPPAGAGPDR